MDRNWHSAPGSEKTPKIRSDCATVSFDVSSFWKWIVEKFDCTSQTVLAVSGGGNAHSGPERFFLSIGTYVFIVCGNRVSLSLETPVWMDRTLYGASYRCFQIIFFRSLSDGYIGRHGVWYSVRAR